MIINNKEARTIIVASKVGSVVLVPGVNVLDDSKYEAIAKNISGVSYLVPVLGKQKAKAKNKDGKEVETEVEVPVDFKDIPVDKVGDVIKSIASLDQLDKLYASETRDSVRQELNRRRAEIEKQLGM